MKKLRLIKVELGLAYLTPGLGDCTMALGKSNIMGVGGGRGIVCEAGWFSSPEGKGSV